jgi:hypothetical protein
MKKSQKIFQFIKETLKNPWAYLGGGIVLYLGLIVLIVILYNSELGNLFAPFAFIFDYFSERLFVFHEYGLFFVFLTLFLSGMILFHGLKKRNKWSFIIICILIILVIISIFINSKIKS